MPAPEFRHIVTPKSLILCPLSLRLVGSLSLRLAGSLRCRAPALNGRDVLKMGGDVGKTFQKIATIRVGGGGLTLGAYCLT